MTPGSFDIDTAKEMLGNERMRSVETKARTDADGGTDAYAPPKCAGSDPYWIQVQTSMARVVYLNAFKKRIDRAARILDRQTTNQR